MVRRIGGLVCLVAMVGLLGQVAACANRSRPGVTENFGVFEYHARAAQGPSADAVRRALHKMEYAFVSDARDSKGVHWIVTRDRQGNQITVAVYPAQGESTLVTVCIDPGQNESMSLLVIKMIDQELRGPAQ